MDLNFILEGQTLKKGKNFPLVVEKSKDFLRIVVDGIPNGYNAIAYFRPSWENGKTYDLIMTENSVVVDEYLTTLPENPSEYVDYVLGVSLAGVNEEGVRFTTNIVDVVLDKTAFSTSTENTPDVPKSQIEEILGKIPTVDQLYDPQSHNAQSGFAVAEAVGAASANCPLKKLYEMADVDAENNGVLSFTVGSDETKRYIVCGVFVTTLGGEVVMCDVNVNDYTNSGYSGVGNVELRFSENVGTVSVRILYEEVDA